jgi:arginine decarboxylase
MPRKDTKAWSVKDADALYRVGGWSAGYYRVNADGNMAVHPSGTKARSIDLAALMADLRRRKIKPPVLIRFMDILNDRVKKLRRCFDKASKEYGYQGAYYPVYPIKVNQQRQVVEAMIDAGTRHDMGLEVGSKPELLAVLALAPNNDSLIICNGYKDREFVETALAARKLGKNVILVVEKFTELGHIIEVAQELDVVPAIGMRVKLAGRSDGRWADTVGDRSKFGLRVPELMQAITLLREHDMLDAIRLLHVHIGSQISQIAKVQTAMAEVTRLYSELARLGVTIRYVDVGGGLGIDYDGTAGRSPFSTNYSVQEYANDVVFALRQVCEAKGLPHPAIITESGRALTAHYSVLVADVIDTAAPAPKLPQFWHSEASQHARELQSLIDELEPRNCRETYHDAVYQRSEALNRFKLGYLSLEDRATVDALYWRLLQKIRDLAKANNLRHAEFEGLDRQLASTYFVNFSIFQSLPDAWAISQRFPIVPIQRLDEEPAVHATLADVTCDSDGHLSEFVSRDESGMLRVHELAPGEDYYLGFFLVGAYQEILGDLHNLFGDTNAVHVTVDRNGKYKIDRFIAGDTVTEVLGYLQYMPEPLIDRMRAKLEKALHAGEVSVDDAAAFMERFEQGLRGYTYLEHRPTNGAVKNGGTS